MDDRGAQIATICECIDHCFAYAVWCDDFATRVDPESMMAGLDRAVELISDATRLHSFLALRKLDDFLGGTQSKADDLTALTLGIDATAILGDIGKRLLLPIERANINKGVAHLTEQLTLDVDSEVDLAAILMRSLPAFARLLASFRKDSAAQSADQSLSQTEALIKHAQPPSEESGSGANG